MEKVVSTDNCIHSFSGEKKSSEQLQLVPVSTEPATYAPPSLPRPVRVRIITRKVASVVSVPVGDIVSSNRKRSLAQLRQLIMYLAQAWSGRSTIIIGQHIGGRDHTTVMHGITQMRQRLAQDDADELKDIIALVHAHILEDMATWLPSPYKMVEDKMEHELEIMSVAA